MRDGVELTGASVTTISADLRVGAVAETITVTGETPVVDVADQRTETQVVLSSAMIESMPAARGLRQSSGDRSGYSGYGTGRQLWRFRPTSSHLAAAVATKGPFRSTG